MGWIEIVVIIFAVALVAFTVIYNVLRRKKGKGPTAWSGPCLMRCDRNRRRIFRKEYAVRETG